MKKYSHSLWLLEPAHLLYVVHQVASVDVFHDKVQTILINIEVMFLSLLTELSAGECMQTESYVSLEAGMQLRQERRLIRKGQDALFNHCAFDVVVLYNHVFF